MDENSNIFHNIIIEGRKKLNISGVKEVISFDDETMMLDSAMGKITVKGDNLNIISFNNDSGDLNATGQVYAVVYISDTKQSGGFLSRLFK